MKKLKLKVNIRKYSKIVKFIDKSRDRYFDL